MSDREGRAGLFIFRWLRGLYDWTLQLSDSRYGVWALFLIAFVESSFFPIPPDVLLIALCIASPRRAFGFAAVCTLGSVLGGAFGYLIGLQFYETVGRRIIEFYSAEEGYQQVRLWYHRWDAMAVLIAGLTPLPYKLFTIAAGVFKINFATFMVASVIGRGTRFFLLGLLIFWCGPAIRDFIDRYFNWLTVAFMVLLVGGFIMIKYVT